MPTLLHERAVVRMFDRKGETQRMLTPQGFDSLEVAWPLMHSIIKARLWHGYRVAQSDMYWGNLANYKIVKA